MAGKYKRNDAKELKRASGFALKIAALSLLEAQVTRIHERGENSSGGLLGRYSPAYAKYRARKGRPSGKVILEFTGDMRRDYSVEDLNPKTVLLGFKNQLNYKKSVWMEQLYGNVYKPTKQEEKLFLKVFEKELEKRIV